MGNIRVQTSVVRSQTHQLAKGLLEGRLKQLVMILR